VLLMGSLGLTYYLVATDVPTYLSTVGDAKPEEGLLASTFAALLYTVLTPFAGSLSDRVGRKPPMFVAAVCFVLVAYPVFLVILDATLPVIILGQAILMGLVIVFTGASTPAISELFTTETRYSGVALGYNIGLTIFGATAPLVATALIKVTGFDEAPGVYLAVASVLVLPLLVRVPETLPGPTAAPAAVSEQPSA
jgi:MHS family proline/betaine transporter-like MFS transporter